MITPGERTGGASPYLLFNLFTGIFLLLLVAYFILTPLLGTPALQCVHKATTGTDCPSCGLTRSIWAFLQWDMERAAAMHAGGLWIGGFFAGQLMLRILGGAAAYYHRTFSDKALWKMDAAFSLLFLVICFGKGYSFF